MFGGTASHRDHNINHSKSRSDCGGNGVVARIVADMAIVTGDSRLKKIYGGLRQKASAGKIGRFARLFPVLFTTLRPISFY